MKYDIAENVNFLPTRSEKVELPLARKDYYELWKEVITLGYFCCSLSFPTFQPKSEERGKLGQYRFIYFSSFPPLVENWAKTSSADIFPRDAKVRTYSLRDGQKNGSLSKNWRAQLLLCAGLKWKSLLAASCTNNCPTKAQNGFFSSRDVKLLPNDLLQLSTIFMRNSQVRFPPPPPPSFRLLDTIV